MFEQCPLAWKRKYIDEEEGEDNFFAQFGSCVHYVLERYAKHEISLFDLVPEYKKSFKKMVIHKLNIYSIRQKPHRSH